MSEYMFIKGKLTSLDDYFLELNRRTQKGVFFYRINGYSPNIEAFLKKYYDAARYNGVIFDGKIPNPDQNNLAFYYENMGSSFAIDKQFISNSLKKWLPRMNDAPRLQVTESVYSSLVELKNQGKSDDMVKNAYVKFMCWFYYKFERIVNKLGENNVPKIMYEGDISIYELMILSILSGAGSDVLIIQHHGDVNYLKLDKAQQISYLYEEGGMTAFPTDNYLKKIYQDMQNAVKMDRLYGPASNYKPCINAWMDIKSRRLEGFHLSMEGADMHLNPMDMVSKSEAERARNGVLDPSLATTHYFTVFARVNGTDNKVTYGNDLYQFYNRLKAMNKPVVIVDNKIENPSNEEVMHIRRENYSNKEVLISNMARNINIQDTELKKIVTRAFVDTMFSEAEALGDNLNKLTSKAVYIIAWLRRYQNTLFDGWAFPKTSCFIHFGGTTNENEAMFLKFLSKLPVDVLILAPELERKCKLQDNLLYEMNNTESISLSLIPRFPREEGSVSMGTAAFHAERELDNIMYQDSGMYRARQYAKAKPIILKTMYEEIEILWNEELKYRPNFSVVDNVVNLPVIFAKVSGVKDKNVLGYMQDIKTLLTPDTFLFVNQDIYPTGNKNPMSPYATSFYENGKLLREKIKSHRDYPYAVLREETQDYMLDALANLISQKIVKGTFERGIEYLTISICLNLPKALVQVIQNFDFTKKNPKIVYINTGDRIMSIEDTILLSYLNMIGFDIVCFVPTGYQVIEKHFESRLFYDHTIGEFVYDVKVPDFKTLPPKAKKESTPVSAEEQRKKSIFDFFRKKK